MSVVKDHINNKEDWEPDHKFMCRKELWTLREAAHNLFNINPCYVEDWQDRYFEIIKLHEIMDMDINQKLLNTYDFNFTGRGGEKSVNSKEFIRWADSKGYPIIEPFQCLLKGKRKGAGQKEKNRIVAIVKKAKELGYEPLAIPYGGKIEIGRILCEEMPGLFKHLGMFNEMWKKARSKNLVRLVDNDDFTKGK